MFIAGDNDDLLVIPRWISHSAIAIVATCVPVTVIGRKVSIGQALQAIVLNDLGFVIHPLYLSPEFWYNNILDGGNAGILVM